MKNRIECSEPDRLDRVLNRHVPASRTRLQKWIQQGRVRVNDNIVTDKSHSVSEGDVCRLEPPESFREDEQGIKPEEGPIDIIHEDEALIVLNKPSGIVVHPTESQRTGTLANRLVAHDPSLASVGPEHRAGLAHRLDYGTSGVLLVARTEPALEHLQSQFKNRTVDKTYRAILSGRLADESLRIEVPIGYNPRNRALRKATPTGQYAETVFRRAGTTEDRTAVRCELITGRTHQIRVHAKYLGHPVVGDDKYGGPTHPRLLLHSESIRVTHPETGDDVTFHAELDQEVQSLWDSITDAHE